MSGVYCPNCGKLHESAGKFYVFCRNDLESLILEYNNQRLPVNLNFQHLKIKQILKDSLIFLKDYFEPRFLIFLEISLLS